MPRPVVEAGNGYGLPVTETDGGLPIEIAENGYGMPVVFVDEGGLPVTGGDRPTAPVLSVVEPVTNPPAFDVDLPSGNGAPLDAAVADVLRVQITLSTDASFASVVEEVTVTLDADDLIADTITVPGLDAQSEGTYIARARLERGSAVSNWSATTDSFAVPSPVVPGNFTYRDLFLGDPSGTSVTRSVDIGTAAADRYVLVATGRFTNQDSTAVTAAGTSLSLLHSSSSAAGRINWWGGLVTSGDGAQNIVATWPSGSFAVRAIATWTMVLGGRALKDTADLEAAISVDAGDWMFALGLAATGAITFDGFTEALTERQAGPLSTLHGASGELTVASTNASFATGVTQTLRDSSVITIGL